MVNVLTDFPFANSLFPQEMMATILWIIASILEKKLIILYLAKDYPVTDIVGFMWKCISGSEDVASTKM